MSTPLDAYKTLIDAIATIADDDVQAKRIADKQPLPESSPSAQLSTLIDKLSTEERATLVEMLRHSRRSGIHDTLAQLNEMIALKGLRLMSNGSELPVEPFGSELFFDWECRRNGDDWPEQAEW